jgi:penicillin-binding protein 1C
LISPSDAAEAKAEPLPHRSPFPALAWHAAGQLAARAPADQASVVTTIDAGLQRRLEHLAALTAQAQGPQTTSAILVVRIRDRAVRAAVGSAGLERPGGWLDMTLALRSPGSALKPFIYGMAFDDGLAAPDTVIEDAPRRFADYQPENFDRVFHGPVTARDALTHSLNVPAVELLSRLGPQKFQARLESAGVRLVRAGAQVAEPGLPLALGGEGVTLRDVAVLYAALGDGGLAKPLAWTEAEAAKRPGQSGQRLMRPDAARQVLDILRETPAPAGRMPSALTRSGPRMAFKTGTSYGFRDALAAGVVGDYAVVVWTGRADGGARGGLTGRDAALPLLFDAADAIDAPLAAPRPIPPSRAPQALQQLETVDTGPRLIFPPDGASVQVEGLGRRARGLALSARGKGLSWYVDGTRLEPDPVTGAVIWRPDAPGFYRVVTVDTVGRKASARVRIKAD